MAKIMMELIKDNKFTYIPLRGHESKMPAKRKRYKAEGYDAVIFYSAIHTGTSGTIKLAPYFKEGVRKSIHPDNVGQNPRAPL